MDDQETAALAQRLPPATRPLLSCLTARQREAYLLREVLGLPFREIGRRLDVTSQGAQLRYGAARRALGRADRQPGRGDRRRNE